MTVQQLKDKIAANSAAWHKTEDEQVRKALHEANVALYGALDAQTGSTSGFDSSTGKWSTSEPGTGTYQATGAPEVQDLSDQVIRSQKAATDKAVARLERARASSAAALKEEAAALQGKYTAAKNRTAAQNEMERHNTAAWANDRGVSSGAAGQIALSQSVAAQNDLGALELQEAAEKDAIARKKSQMEMDYDYAVAEARAEGDYALAEALYKEASRFDAAQRQKWLDTEEMARDVYGMARDTVIDRDKAQAQREADAYEKEQDALNWAFKLEQQKYDREQDAWKREQTETNDAWERQRAEANDAWERQRAEANDSWEHQRAESSDAWERQRDLVSENLQQQSINNTRRATQLRLAQGLADYGDFSGYSGLGYSQSQISQMSALWRKFMNEKKK